MKSHTILISLLIILLLVLGCVPQQKCPDSDYSKCPQQKCPDLDCNNCPKQTETITITKYQCYDGATISNLADCPTITNIRDNTNFKSDSSFCSKPENYNLEKISIKSYSEEQDKNLGETFSDSQYSSNKWYPSLNEGWIGNYPLKVINEGCTKIDKSNVRVSYYLYHNNQLIFKEERTNEYLNWLILQDDIYPQEDDTIRRGISYDNSGELFTITDNGEYIIKIKLYYKDVEIGLIDDLIIIN